MDEQNDFGDLSDMLDRFEGQIDRDAETSDVIGGSETVGSQDEPQAGKTAARKRRLFIKI